MSADYVEHLERSAAVVQALDPEQVAGASIGEVVYKSDRSVRHALGKFALTSGGSVHLGLELSIGPHFDFQSLLVDRLIGMHYVGSRAPELLDRGPSFIGAVAGEGDTVHWAHAMLTEDLTQGGRLRRSPISTGLLAKFHKAGINESLDGAKPPTVEVVKVQGIETVVQFIPAWRMTSGQYGPLESKIRQAQEGLTIALPEGSKLAQALNKPLGRTVV
jgi:hypothetical protein